MTDNPDIAKATVRPWAIEENVFAGGVLHLAVTNRKTGRENWMPCSVTPMAWAREVDYANAALIVKAVNEYAELVSVARQLLCIVECSNRLYPKETAPWDREIERAKKVVPEESL